MKAKNPRRKQRKETLQSEPSQEQEEKKIKNDFISSGERK